MPKPLAWYQFDNPSNLGLDTMKKYNLTNPKSITTTTGIVGTYAASFNGSQRLEISNSGINLNNSSISVSAWTYRKINNVYLLNWMFL
jgi:hypothetical protein